MFLYVVPLKFGRFVYQIITQTWCLTPTGLWRITYLGVQSHKDIPSVPVHPGDTNPQVWLRFLSVRSGVVLWREQAWFLLAVDLGFLAVQTGCWPVIQGRGCR